MPKNLKPFDESLAKAYSPTGEEKDVQQHVKTRVKVLKDTKKSIPGGVNFETVMRAADREYAPLRYSEKQQQDVAAGFVGSTFDENLGLRGTRVASLRSDKNSWRSDVSAPTLFVKIQTALAYLIDQNPEAVFKPGAKQFEKTSALAYSLWKRSWDMGQSKEQLKLFWFNAAKYGWSVARTFPRVVKAEGEVIDELDIEDPDKTTFKKKTVVEYNDIWREVLDPYRTYLDDMTNLADPWSCNDWYYEKDYSYDAFMREFGQYENSQYVKPGMEVKEERRKEDVNAETDKRMDKITVGFFESKSKDLYAIVVPSPFDIVIYYSPLPNDDKKLSCWFAPFFIRDIRTPYGIGFYELLKSDKDLYDQLNNLSMDALTLAVLPMLFYSGSNENIGSGDINITPGVLKQKLPGTTIEQVKVQFEASVYQAISLLAKRMDESTGVTDSLSGQEQGPTKGKKTLGQIVQELQNSLKRLSVPLSSICTALEHEAYLSLSWMKQLYTTPDVQQFATLKEIAEYEQETGERANANVAKKKKGKYEAKFYPTLALHMDQDDEGNLLPSSESLFFQINPNIQKGQTGFIHPDDMKWAGIVKIKAQSLLNPNVIMQVQQTLELFNLVAPLLAQPPEVGALYVKPLKQVLSQMDKKPEEWLPDKWLEIDAMGVDKYMQQQQMAQNNAQPLMVPYGGQGGTNQPGAKPAAGGAPGANKVVPQGQLTNTPKDMLKSIQSMPSMGKI